MILIKWKYSNNKYIMANQSGVIDGVYGKIEWTDNINIAKSFSLRKEAIEYTKNDPKYWTDNLVYCSIHPLNIGD